MRSLGSSVRSLINVKIDSKPKHPLISPFQGTIFLCSKAEWDSFRSNIAEAPLLAFFKNRAPLTPPSDQASSFQNEFFLSMRVLYRTKCISKDRLELQVDHPTSWIFQIDRIKVIHVSRDNRRDNSQI